MTQAVALTIAGSDSGAGAGIQADLKTFAAFHVYGLSAVTAVTAQNTTGVRAVQDVTPELVVAQIEALAEDFPIDALKTGMLANAGIVLVVADAIRRHRLAPLVVDPVMVAKGGTRLLPEDAVEALRTELLPMAAVVTPNLPEAEALTGGRIRSMQDRITAGRAILACGARAVVIKGGHGEEDPLVDLLIEEGGVREFRGPRVETRNTHGTGCTFSAAIAALLAGDRPLAEAVGAARAYVEAALQQAPGLGHGHGPLNHFPATTQPVEASHGAQ
jgi:hydroxymethylpyrimidine/phosphomethylpyrimidine kinase